jgi:hypothetical protein
MASTTKLIVYNDAIRELGSSPLANLTTPNTRLQELEGAFPHAVEYLLAKKDWAFARRRASLTGVADTAYPPYTYRLSKPSGYLRKCWLKTAAPDAHQIDHVEVAAVFYSMQPSCVIEFVSDDAENYEPANWPPYFTRCAVLYLAQLTASKLARAGAGDAGAFDRRFREAMEDADGFEASFVTNTAIPSNYQPVLRRAIEIMGQQLAGSVAIHSQADMLRWQMVQAWDHTIKYCLEQGAWNFATSRALLTGGGEVVPGDTYSGVIEGYSVPPAAAVVVESTTDMAGYEYGYILPDDYLHKIWIKRDATSDFEVHHQVMGRNIYASEQPVVLEYIARNDFTTDPENWPATFLELVACRLALTAAPELMIEAGAKGRARINAPQIREKLMGEYMRLLYEAKNKDAIQQEVGFVPVGSYVRARLGGYSYGRRLR